MWGGGWRFSISKRNKIFSLTLASDLTRSLETRVTTTPTSSPPPGTTGRKDFSMCRLLLLPFHLVHVRTLLASRETIVQLCVGVFQGAAWNYKSTLCLMLNQCHQQRGRFLTEKLCTFSGNTLIYPEKMRVWGGDGCTFVFTITVFGSSVETFTGSLALQLTVISNNRVIMIMVKV